MIWQFVINGLITGILGAYIGEFVASEAGLEHIILKTSGLYDTTYVLVAIICIILLSFIFSIIVLFINKYKLGIIRYAINLASHDGILQNLCNQEKHEDITIK